MEPLSQVSEADIMRVTSPFSQIHKSLCSGVNDWFPRVLLKKKKIDHFFVDSEWDSWQLENISPRQALGMGA